MEVVRYLSLCSGIEAATVAWHPLGWECAGVSEIEPFPNAVLAHHYPSVMNYGDMTKFKEWDYGRIGAVDLLVGGTPCQSFSVAGLRQGLADPRGNLMLVFLAIAERLRPRWIVWENVPGVLSSAGGRDFGTFLGSLGNLGYGWAYRVLDAQWVRTQRHPKAVPQRRRRVFVVGCLGDQRRAASVLFESESVCRDTAKGEETRQGVAPTISNRAKGGGELGTDAEFDGASVAHSLTRKWEAGEDDTGRGTPLVATMLGHEVSPPCQARDCKGPSSNNDQFPCIVCYENHGQDSRVRRIEVASLHAKAGTGGGNLPLVAMHESGPGYWMEDDITGTIRAEGESRPSRPSTVLAIRTAQTSANGHGIAEGISHTLDRASGQAVAFSPQSGRDMRGCELRETPQLQRRQVSAVLYSSGAIHTGMRVRRLTPIECERLMGFPDNYTAIPWRGKPSEQCPDGPRYKALGNSMAVNCMEWIGERIDKASRREAEGGKGE